jgi:multiple sugar transport system permease protein
MVIFDAFNSNGSLESSAIGSFRGLTVANFEYVIHNTPMLLYFWNSVRVCIAATICTVIIGGLAGYAMSRYNVGWLSGYSVGLVFIQTFPIILFLIPLFTILKVLGLVDTLPSVVIVYVTQSLPFAILMFRSFFDSLPREMEEAAWVDGASRLRGFIRIICPNSWPAAVSVAIFTFLVAWGDYLVAYVMLTGPNVLTLPIGMERFQEQYQSLWGPLFASGALMMVPPIIVFGALQRYYNLQGVADAVGR